ncbi:unnamed protein product [Caretta caretta]
MGAGKLRAVESYQEKHKRPDNQDDLNKETKTLDNPRVMDPSPKDGLEGEETEQYGGLQHHVLPFHHHRSPGLKDYFQEMKLKGRLQMVKLIGCRIKSF